MPLLFVLFVSLIKEAFEDWVGGWHDWVEKRLLLVTTLVFWASFRFEKDW